MSASDQEKLRHELSRRIEADVSMRLFLDDAPASLQATALVEELSRLSPRLSVRVEKEHELANVPVILLEGAAPGVVRFTGLPTGYEFPTLIESLIAVSTGRSALSRDSLELVASIASVMRLRVFTTPT